MLDFLKRYLTWWNGGTVAVMFFTRRSGVKVGEDAEGNVYYRNADDSRRWVIYDGEVEASRISPDWHGWLHFTWNEPPTDKPLPKKAWEKPHLPNLTSTDAAYHPPGSLATAGARPRVSGDYEAWQPE